MNGIEQLVLPASLVRDLHEDCLEEEDAHGFEHAEIIKGSRGRWRQDMTLVVRRIVDGKLFGVNYQQGLTENCDSSYPWEDGEDIALTEMEQVTIEVIKTRYKRAS